MGCADNLVRLFTVAGDALTPAGELSGHTAPVTALAFSPDQSTDTPPQNKHSVFVLPFLWRSFLFCCFGVWLRFLALCPSVCWCCFLCICGDAGSMCACLCVY